MVQLGLFKKRSKVDEVKKKLDDLGIALNIEDVTVSGETYQRLRTEPYAERQKAREIADRVEQIFGIKATLIQTKI